MQPKTPNVYIQEKSIFPPSVAEVATAIPAFIGRTELMADGAGDSLVNQPIRITSMLEYERWFGGPYLEGFEFDAIQDPDTGAVIGVTPAREDARKPDPVAKFILYHCVEHYFANGGGACYVVSTGDYAGFGATVPGEEADQFGAALAAIEKVDEVTLLVTSDAAARMTGADSVQYYGIGTAAIDQCVKMQDRFALVDTIDSMDFANPLSMDADIAALRDNTPVTTDRNKYGATYYPYLRTTMARSYDESQVTVKLADDSSVAMSDDSLSGTAVYAELKSQLGSQYMVLPPCAAVAGIYSRVDGSRGVWKAPANVAVSNVVGPTRIIDNATQEGLNVDTVAGKSVNAIRAFTGKGTLVW
ncbi:MAG: phage tail sheath subtilisin-like domain-containing protein, partial [Porticoccaceae bacterium]|nr:phage tail sheath subtilisin-like domain-containing protein [Porticoccaceae bacterium]